MKMKLLANGLYGVGLLLFIALAGLALFGAGFVPNPGAMIPWSLRELAFVGLALGAAPMGLACMAVYTFNSLKQSRHKKRNFLLVFLPCFLCGACLVTVLVILAVMVVQAMLYTAP